MQACASVFGMLYKAKTIKENKFSSFFALTPSVRMEYEPTNN